MAKAWITDLWVKDAVAVLSDGTKTRLTPTPAQLRALHKLPEEFRTRRFMRGNRWQVRWNDSDGRKRAKTFAQKAHAEEFAVSLEDEIRSGKYAPNRYAQQPFEELAAIWMETKAATKPSTLRRYSRDLAYYVLPAWRGVPIDQITRQQVQQWVNQMSAGTHPHGTREKPRPLSAATVRHAHSKVFGAILRYAVGEGWLASNPAARTALPKPAYKDELEVLTYREVEQVADAAAAISTQVDRLLVLTLATCGLRIGEAAALQKRHVRLDARRIHVKQGWIFGQTYERILSTPKSGKPRMVPIPDFLATELKPHLDGLEADDFVFHSKRSKATPISFENWGLRVFTPALAAAGIDKERGITPHKLRHTAASHAIAAGADVKVLQLMLGHANATETLDIYGHLFPDKLDTVMDAVSAFRAKELGA